MANRPVRKPSWSVVALICGLSLWAPGHSRVSAQQSPLSAQAAAARAQGWRTLIMPVSLHVELGYPSLDEVLRNHSALLVSAARLNAAQSVGSRAITTWHTFRIEQRLSERKPVYPCDPMLPLTVADTEVAIEYIGGTVTVDGVAITSVNSSWDEVRPQEGDRFLVFGSYCRGGELGLDNGAPAAMFPVTLNGRIGRSPIAQDFHQELYDLGTIERLAERIAKGPDAPGRAVPARPTAIINGTVSDERGEPVGGVYVQAFALVSRGGDPVLGAPTATSRSNDLGAFSLRVPAGDHVVAAVMEGMATVSNTRGVRRLYPTTYHPAARTVSDARVLHVRDNDVLEVGIQLAPVPAVEVRGQVVSDAGLPASFMSLSLQPVRTANEPRDSTIKATSIEADGSFAFTGVQPGRYALELVTPGARLRALDVGDTDPDAVRITVPDDLLHVLGRRAAPVTPGRVAGTGSVYGIVRLAGSATPLNRVRVTLRNSMGQFLWATSSDISGKFELQHIGAGEYRLVAEREGFTSLDDRVVRLVDQQHLEANVELSPGGVITGTVFGTNGLPLVGASVSIARHQTVGGKPSFSGAAGAGGGGPTDATGGYRFYGLRSGQYVVSVSLPPQGGAFAAPPTYFPGTLSPADAVPIVVEAGRQAASADIRLRAGGPFKVAGTVTLAGDPSSGNLTMTLIRNDMVASSAPYPGTAQRQPGGRFVFDRVPPGRYRLLAQSATRSRDGVLYWAVSDVVVDNADVNDLQLALEPASTIAGSLRVEGGSTDLAPRFRMSLVPTKADYRTEETRAARIGSQHEFLVEGIVPGTYKLSVVPISGADTMPWTVASVQVAGRDVGSEGFEVGRGVHIEDVVITLRLKPLPGRP